MGKKILVALLVSIAAVSTFVAYSATDRIDLCYERISQHAILLDSEWEQSDSIWDSIYDTCYSRYNPGPYEEPDEDPKYFRDGWENYYASTLYLRELLDNYIFWLVENDDFDKEAIEEYTTEVGTTARKEVDELENEYAPYNDIDYVAEALFYIRYDQQEISKYFDAAKKKTQNNIFCNYGQYNVEGGDCYCISGYVYDEEEDKCYFDSSVVIEDDDDDDDDDDDSSTTDDDDDEENEIENPFSDLYKSHRNYDAILYLRNADIISGYDDGTFKPANDVNRAELLRILVEGVGVSPTVTEYKNCFTDVKTDWYAPYVCYAKEQGWVDGYPDGSFKPAQTVNKVEAIKMLLNSQGIDVASSVSSNPFDDVKTSDWFAPFVAKAKELGILEETGSLLSPAEGMKRAGISENLYRLLTRESQST